MFPFDINGFAVEPLREKTGGKHKKEESRDLWASNKKWLNPIISAIEFHVKFCI